MAATDLCPHPLLRRDAAATRTFTLPVDTLYR
jgi:hypothetical protein